MKLQQPGVLQRMGSWTQGLKLSFPLPELPLLSPGSCQWPSGLATWLGSSRICPVKATHRNLGWCSVPLMTRVQEVTTLLRKGRKDLIRWDIPVPQQSRKHSQAWVNKYNINSTRPKNKCFREAWFLPGHLQIVRPVCSFSGQP